MRRAHFLAPTSSNSYPSECVWFDTETSQHDIGDDTVEHRLTFGWAAYCRRVPSGGWSKPKWLRFTSKEQFWDWVVSLHRPKTKLYMFCHNTSFDLPVLDSFHALPERGYKLLGAVIDAPPTIIRYRADRGTIQILDTLNIWRLPLASLGESIGLHKLSFPQPSDSPEVWDTYARRDVEVIMRACLDWFAFLRRNDFGGFANTLAAQSLRTYRHRFLQVPILIDDHPLALDVARRAYHGGRTECGYIGHMSASFTLLDINSMYPHVMESCLYPTSLRTTSIHCSVSDLARWASDSCVCADVTLDTDEPVYPLRDDKRLIFPVGRFRTHLSTPEILYALEHKHIVEVHRAAIYNRGDIFSGFVREMYGRRLEYRQAGNETESWRFKILANSLYGKFGQNGIVYDTEDSTSDLSARKWTEIDAQTGEVAHWRQFGGLVQKLQKEGESRESHPAIAAHVTAYARMLLWKYMKECGHDHYYYLDTDSLLVDATGLRRLRKYIHDTDLGALKVELECDEITIFGPKDYRIGPRAKTKGVKKSAKWIAPNKVSQEKWSSLKGLIGQGRVTSPTTQTIEKTLHRVYNKGIVNKDGSVRPYLVGHDSLST